jgi:hypothetical protein
MSFEINGTNGRKTATNAFQRIVRETITGGLWGGPLRIVKGDRFKPLADKIANMLTLTDHGQGVGTLKVAGANFAVEANFAYYSKGKDPTPTYHVEPIKGSGDDAAAFAKWAIKEKMMNAKTLLTALAKDDAKNGTDNEVMARIGGV